MPNLFPPEFMVLPSVLYLLLPVFCIVLPAIDLVVLAVGLAESVLFWPGSRFVPASVVFILAKEDFWLVVGRGVVKVLPEILPLEAIVAVIDELFLLLAIGKQALAVVELDVLG